MSDQYFARKLSFIVVLLIGLQCVGSVWADIIFRYVNPVIVQGQELLAEKDYSQLPAMLRWSNRISTFGLLLAGLYFAYDARWIKSLRAPLLAYAVTWCWALYLLVAKTTVPLQVVTTVALFSNFAPGTLGILGLFFLTAREELWQETKDNIAWLIVTIGFAIFVLAPFVEAGSRFSGRRYVGSLTTLLQLCAVAPIFIKSRGVPRFMSYVPMAASFLCGILVQTRLTFVLTFVQLLSIVLLKRRHIFTWMVKPRLSFRQTVALFFAVGFAMAAVVTALIGPFRQSTDAFANRLDEDTRTKQAATFFEKIPVESLLLGHGYPTSDEYTSQGEDGIDVGFINAAYVGGLPADFCIVYFLVLPGILLIRLRDVDEAVQVVPVCLTTGIAFLSSTVFAVSPGGVLFMILFGGRAYFLAHRKFSRASAASTAPALERMYAR